MTDAEVKRRMELIQKNVADASEAYYAVFDECEEEIEATRAGCAHRKLMPAILPEAGFTLCDLCGATVSVRRKRKAKRATA